MEKKSFYLIIVAIAVIAGLAVFMFGRSKPATLQPSPVASTGSVDTPIITNAVMSRSIDAKGNATGIATTFMAKTDKIVYAVLSLKNVTSHTKLSYVRYLNGMFVDSKVAMPTKDGATTFYFAFEKGIGDYPKGTYTLNLYANGRHMQTLTYVFK